MESFDYNAELAPDLVKLLSAKLSDARKVRARYVTAVTVVAG